MFLGNASKIKEISYLPNSTQHINLIIDEQFIIIFYFFVKACIKLNYRRDGSRTQKWSNIRICGCDRGERHVGRTESLTPTSMFGHFVVLLTVNGDFVLVLIKGEDIRGVIKSVHVHFAVVKYWTVLLTFLCGLSCFSSSSHAVYHEREQKHSN